MYLYITEAKVQCPFYWVSMACCMCTLQCNLKNTVIIISELQNLNRCQCSLFFLYGKKNPLKIFWSLDKNSIAIFLVSLCRVFMIQMIQGKLQCNLLEKTFQLSWSHQPGECWWHSQCRNEEAVSLRNSYPIRLLLLLPLAHLCSSPLPRVDLILNVLLEL